MVVKSVKRSALISLLVSSTLAASLGAGFLPAASASALQTARLTSATVAPIPPSRVTALHKFSPSASPIMMSPNKDHKMFLQPDGNLVLYTNCKTTCKAAWATMTVGAGAGLWFQNDGNLVLYKPNWDLLVPSMSNGKGGKYLQLQDDGNLVVLNAAYQAVWNLKGNQLMFKNLLAGGGTTGGSTGGATGGSTGGGNSGGSTGGVGSTCQKSTSVACAGTTFKLGDELKNGNYRLVLQKDDGNWVLYNGKQPMFASGADKGTRLVFQNDGNLVLYGANNVVKGATMSEGGDKLQLQTDGNVVIYKGNEPLWALFGKGGSTPILKPLTAPPTPTAPGKPAQCGVVSIDTGGQINTCDLPVPTIIVQGDITLSGAGSGFQAKIYFSSGNTPGRAVSFGMQYDDGAMRWLSENIVDGHRYTYRAWEAASANRPYNAQILWYQGSHLGVFLVDGRPIGAFGDQNFSNPYIVGPEVNVKHDGDRVTASINNFRVDGRYAAPYGVDLSTRWAGPRPQCNQKYDSAPGANFHWSNGTSAMGGGDWDAPMNWSTCRTTANYAGG